MDLALIEQLMRMLEQSGLQELDVNDGATRIRLAKKRTLGLDTPDAALGAAVPTPPEAVPAGPHRILSGMTGTFYRASSPDVAPYVTEGSEVQDGQRLALIEAMKTFNPIECDIAGRIVKILATDGELVAQGAPLFEIETP